MELQKKSATILYDERRTRREVATILYVEKRRRREVVATILYVERRTRKSRREADATILFHTSSTSAAL